MAMNYRSTGTRIAPVPRSSAASSGHSRSLWPFITGTAHGRPARAVTRAATWPSVARTHHVLPRRHRAHQSARHPGRPPTRHFSCQLQLRSRRIAAVFPDVSSARRTFSHLSFALIRQPLIRPRQIQPRGISTYQRQRERRSAGKSGHAAGDQRTGQNHAHAGSWYPATPLDSARPAAPPSVDLEP